MWPQCQTGNYTRTWKSMCTSQIESASYDPHQGHDKKHDLSPASPAYSLSAYSHDLGAGQISVAQHTDVATNNETLNYLPQYWWDATAVSVL